MRDLRNSILQDFRDAARYRGTPAPHDDEPRDLVVEAYSDLWAVYRRLVRAKNPPRIVTRTGA